MFNQKEIIHACKTNSFTILKILLDSGKKNCNKNPETIQTNLRGIIVSEIKNAMALLVEDEYKELGDLLAKDSDDHPDDVTIPYYLLEVQKKAEYHAYVQTIQDCLIVIQDLIEYHNKWVATPIPKLILNFHFNERKPVTDTNPRKQRIFTDSPKQNERLIPKETEEVDCCVLF